MRHFVVVGILIVVVTVLTYLGLSAAGLMPLLRTLWRSRGAPVAVVKMS